MLGGLCLTHFSNVEHIFKIIFLIFKFYLLKIANSLIGQKFDGARG